MEQRIVLHVDFDYFYAQCEEIRTPALKTKPVAVCMFSDRGGDSGAIATANYTARKFGVKSGLCLYIFAKQTIGRIEKILFFCHQILNTILMFHQKAMNIMKEYADIFEYVGT